MIQFRQSKWLGDFMSGNTVMRKQAVNDFEKNFYKLMSNACFSKTMENLRNRREISLVSSKEQAEKAFQKPIFKGFRIIHDSLVSVTMTPSKKLWNKPTPVGASILHLSKLCVYKLHYEEMKPRYHQRYRLFSLPYRNERSIY